MWRPHMLVLFIYPHSMHHFYSFLFILVVECSPGIYRESLPEAPALRRDVSQMDRLVVL